MNLLPRTTESPRLLSTAAKELSENRTSADAKSKIRLAGESLFTGNGRAIFIGAALGAAGICSVGYFYESRHAAAESAGTRKLVAIGAEAVKPTGPSATPRVVVHIPPESLRVTAIALGRPPLARLNGKEVTEGDFVTVEVGGVKATLQVVKIADRSIDLTDGTQIITTRMLSQARSPAARR